MQYSIEKTDPPAAFFSFNTCRNPLNSLHNQKENMSKTIIKTNNAPAPIGPYNQAIFAGNTLYISGQICLDPLSGELRNKDIQEETHQVMHNLKNILQEAGMDFSDVVKTTIFITDMHQFGAVNEVYGKYFENRQSDRQPAFPARETVQVSALPKFVNVEISMIAVKL
jgi:2-iminobutanoate/2-iminopropanoate deaminase